MNHGTNPIPIDPPSPADPVVRDCDFFTRTHVWPLHSRIDPREWLGNFEPSEIPYALDLLASFRYFNETISEELFRSSVQRLGAHVLDFNRPATSVRSDWRQFIGNLMVIPVRGEIPNPSDSGYAYVRKSQELFGFDESQFVDVETALALMFAQSSTAGTRAAVVFVDDFVGSGNQFVETWEREYSMNGGAGVSFKDLAATAHLGPTSQPRFFYCPLICTEEGAKHIRDSCPEVVLSAAHILSSEYSAFHQPSRIWDPSRAGSAEDVLRRIALRTGMPDTGGNSVDDWRGFYGLGLCLAIRDSIPDANLGVFRWDEGGWIPLFKKPA